MLDIKAKKQVKFLLSGLSIMDFGLRYQNLHQGTLYQTRDNREQEPSLKQSSTLSQGQVHKNVMEDLVTEEINRQLKKISPKLVLYLNPVEIATFALNRLPAMYASSEEGLRRQEEKARKDHGQQITKAVRQAFAAVQRDPIRFSTPLLPKDLLESQEAKEALKEMQDLLQQDELSWKSLAKVVKQALVHPAYRTIVTKKEAAEGEEDYDWEKSYRF